MLVVFFGHGQVQVQQTHAQYQYACVNCTSAMIRVANRGQYVGIRLWHPRARSGIRLWTKPRLISVVLGCGRYCSVIGRLQAVTSNNGVTDNATVYAVTSLRYIVACTPRQLRDTT